LKVLRGLGQAFGTLRGPAAVRLSLGVLAVAFVLVTGLWIREMRANDATRSDLASQLSQYQSQDAALRQQTSQAPASLKAKYAAAQTALQEQTSSLFGAPDQVALMVTLAGLADRIGVSYNGLNVSAPSGATLAGVKYDARSASIAVQGSQDSVSQFINAIQDGVIPGASLEHLSLSRDGAHSNASLSLKIYTIPTGKVQFGPPASLGPILETPGTVSGGNGLPREVAIGAVSAPVMTWSVQSHFARSDALVSAGFVVDAAPNAVKSYQLYAESSGDGTLETRSDKLLATIPAPADGHLNFVLDQPFHFAAGQGQRFYLTATVSPTARPGMLNVSAPADSMQFLSSAWPDAAHASEFHSQAAITAPPQAPDVTQSVLAGAVSRVRVDAPGQQSGLTLTVVAQPKHGTLRGGLSSLTYAPAPGFSGSDEFTYVLSDGALTSRVATVHLEVTSATANDSGRGSAPSGQTAASAS